MAITLTSTEAGNLSKNPFRKAVGKYLILEFDDCTLPFEITGIVGLKIDPVIEENDETWLDSNVYGIMREGDTLIPVIDKSLPPDDSDPTLPRTVLVTKAKCFSCSLLIGILITVGEEYPRFAYSLTVA